MNGVKQKTLKIWFDSQHISLIFAHLTPLYNSWWMYAETEMSMYMYENIWIIWKNSGPQ